MQEIGTVSRHASIPLPCWPGTITENTDTGWEIHFCNDFFRQKYLNDITNGEKRSAKSLPDLVSYEHTLAHEWTHIDLLGSSFHGELLPYPSMNSSVLTGIHQSWT